MTVPDFTTVTTEEKARWLWLPLYFDKRDGLLAAVGLSLLRIKSAAKWNQARRPRWEYAGHEEAAPYEVSSLGLVEVRC
jgi:hypothetical protein